MTSERSSVFFTKRTVEELEALQKAYGENRSRVISRLVAEAYTKLKEELANDQRKNNLA